MFVLGVAQLLSQSGIKFQRISISCAKDLLNVPNAKKQIIAIENNGTIIVHNSHKLLVRKYGEFYLFVFDLINIYVLHFLLYCVTLYSVM